MCWRRRFMGCHLNDGNMAKPSPKEPSNPDYRRRTELWGIRRRSLNVFVSLSFCISSVKLISPSHLAKSRSANDISSLLAEHKLPECSSPRYARAMIKRVQNLNSSLDWMRKNVKLFSAANIELRIAVRVEGFGNLFFTIVLYRSLCNLSSAISLECRGMEKSARRKLSISSFYSILAFPRAIKTWSAPSKPARRRFWAWN